MDNDIEEQQCFTKGTEQLVQVTGFPFFREGDVQNVVALRLYWKTTECYNNVRERKREWRSAWFASDLQSGPLMFR